MLCITRLPRQSVIIPNAAGTIEINISKLSGNHITLAFDMPKEVQAIRKEIFDPAKVKPNVIVPPPAGVFIVVYSSVDDLQVAPKAFVNRARALSVAQAWIGPQNPLNVANQPDENRVFAIATEGFRSVIVYHLPTE